MVTLCHARSAVRLLLGSALLIFVLCTAPTAQAASPGGVPVTHQGRWVLVNRTQQHLFAYDGATLVRDTAVSTGIIGHETPVGSFTIQRRFLSQEMKGPGYDLPNVPYVQYFGNDRLSWQESYSLHGTYWHHNFGHPMSHGCVNLPTDFAAWLWNWAGIGAPVEIIGGS